MNLEVSAAISAAKLTIPTDIFVFFLSSSGHVAVVPQFRPCPCPCSSLQFGIHFTMSVTAQKIVSSFGSTYYSSVILKF